MELEVYSQVMIRRHIFSPRFLREWPEIEANVKKFKEDIENGVIFKNEMPELHERMFLLSAKIVADGGTLQSTYSYRGEVPYTENEEFMASLPYAEINPFQGKRY